MHSQSQGLNTIAFPSCLASNLSSSKKYSHCTEICLTVKIFLSQTVVIKSFKITQSPPPKEKKVFAPLFDHSNRNNLFLDNQNLASIVHYCIHLLDRASPTLVFSLSGSGISLSSTF